VPFRCEEPEGLLKCAVNKQGDTTAGWLYKTKLDVCRTQLVVFIKWPQGLLGRSIREKTEPLTAVSPMGTRRSRGFKNEIQLGLSTNSRLDITACWLFTAYRTGDIVNGVHFSTNHTVCCSWLIPRLFNDVVSIVDAAQKLMGWNDAYKHYESGRLWSWLI
jgi:hypothetical protein